MRLNTGGPTTDEEEEGIKFTKISRTKNVPKASNKEEIDEDELPIYCHENALFINFKTIFHSTLGLTTPLKNNKGNISKMIYVEDHEYNIQMRTLDVRSKQLIAET